jgi:hypothetical protein
MRIERIGVCAFTTPFTLNKGRSSLRQNPTQVWLMGHHAFDGDFGSARRERRRLAQEREAEMREMITYRESHCA